MTTNMGAVDLLVRAAGSTQMRTDLDLLARAEGGAPPVFRCYVWAPRAVSIGRHQSESDIDARVARQLGFDIVRRPTGGRAVVHQGDLSFAWVFPKSDPWPQALRDVYGTAGVLFRRAFEALGLTPGRPASAEAMVDSPVSAEATAGKPAVTNATAGISPLCFADLGCAELTLGGRKAVGWAARVTRRAVLLHGTLYIDPLPADLPARLLRVVSAVEPPETRQSSPPALGVEWPGLTAERAAAALCGVFREYHEERERS